MWQFKRQFSSPQVLLTSLIISLLTTKMYKKINLLLFRIYYSALKSISGEKVMLLGGKDQTLFWFSDNSNPVTQK